MSNVVSNIDCSNCTGSSVCLIHEIIPDALWKQFEDQRIFKSFEKEEIIFFEGATPAGIWTVCTGRAKLARYNENGKAVTLRLAYPGVPIGYRAFISEEEYKATAIAIEKTTAAFIPKSFIEKLLSDDPKAGYKLMVYLSRELGKAESKASDFAIEEASVRILDVVEDLLETESRYGSPTDTIQITRRELADLCALTPETTVRVLKKLEASGELVLTPKSIQIVA